VNPVVKLPSSPEACIALTFDDGPDPKATPAVLDVLEAEGVPATFFVVGERAAANPGLVTRAVDGGMGIGVHGWQHARLVDRGAADVTEQLTRALSFLWSLDVDPCLFRAPFGAWDDTTLDVAEQLGLLPVKWDVAPRDWSSPGADEVVRRVVDAVVPGSIVLLHDFGPGTADTIAALPGIIDGLRGAGFTFVELGSTLVPL
jgi:peptidoglycan/xylan/chitin deacetylase (PgdA/CDA1 family)